MKSAVFWLCIGALSASFSIHFWPTKPHPVVIAAPHPITLLAIERCGVTDALLIILSDGSVHEFSAPKTDTERAQANALIQKLLEATRNRHYVYRESAGCV